MGKYDRRYYEKEYREAAKTFRDYNPYRKTMPEHLKDLAGLIVIIGITIGLVELGVWS